METNESKDTITPKQRAFIDEYLKDKNATQAAIRAGYSAKTAQQQGSRMLLNVVVSREIKLALKRISQKAELKAADVMAEIRRLAFVDLSKAFGEDGAVLHPQDMPKDIRAALASLEIDEIFAGRGPARQKIGETKKMKLFDKVRSLEMLAKHFKLLTESVEVTNADHSSAPKTADEAAKVEARIKELTELRNRAGSD